MRTFLFVISAIVAIVIGGLAIHALSDNGGNSSNGSTQTVESDDPVLKQLRDKNPQLDIVKRLQDDFDRVPVYWVKERTSGHTVMMPRSLVEDGAAIAFVACDLSRIAHRLRYPGGTEPMCVQITNDKVKLSAFYFVTPGRMSDLVDHYDGPHPNGARRLSRWQEESRHEGILPDGSRGFLYSYYFYETGTGTTWQVSALVGYDREREKAAE